MNIHEYQGKEILASYGVRIQRGIVANNAVEAVAAKQLTTETGTSWYVVSNSSQVDVKRCELTCKKLTTSRRDFRSNYWNAIGTPQTSAEVKKVHKVLVAEDVYYPGESETQNFMYLFY
jgi:succinyl-CoA synthetase beta subunit